MDSRIDEKGKLNTSTEKKINNNGQSPIQFYITKDMKKRLKMYCASVDEKMTCVLTDMLDNFLKSKGF